MDTILEKRLRQLSDQNDVLKKAESLYLELDANRKPMLAQLTLKQEGKSFAEKEAKAYASKEWAQFSKGLVQAETGYNFEKRRFEILDKAFLAEYGTFKRDDALIRRGA